MLIFPSRASLLFYFIFSFLFALLRGSHLCERQGGESFIRIKQQLKEPDANREKAERQTRRAPKKKKEKTGDARQWSPDSPRDNDHERANKGNTG